jgi:hypothetical protein
MKSQHYGDPAVAERVRWAQVVEDAGLGTASIPMLMRAAHARNFSLVRMFTVAEVTTMTASFKADKARDE